MMSLCEIQDLMLSRERCRRLMTFLSSASCFSFWLWVPAFCTLSQMLSKDSTPSFTFFSVRSISAGKEGGG